MHKRGLYEDRSLPLTKSTEKDTIQAFRNEIRHKNKRYKIKILSQKSDVKPRFLLQNQTSQNLDFFVKKHAILKIIIYI